MTGSVPRTWVVALFLVGSAGCVTCRHEAFRVETYDDVGPGLTACQRNRVHTYIVCGTDPLGVTTLTGLRDELNRAGYAKVSVGECVHAGTFRREIERTARHDPDARFVLIGYGYGAADAHALAVAATAAGAAADAVVLLDPAYLVGPGDVPAGTRVTVITAVGWKGTAPGAPEDVVALPTAGHLSLPTHPHVVETVFALVNESAARLPAEVVTEPALPILDNPAPMPGQLPVAPTAAPQPPPTQVVPPGKRQPVEGVLTTTPKPVR